MCALRKREKGGRERDRENYIIFCPNNHDMPCHKLICLRFIYFLYKQQRHTCVGIERETTKVRARKWKRPMDACHVARRCGSYHNPFRKETLEMNS